MSLLSAATVTAVGLTCKTFINLGLCSVSVTGLHNLVTALESDARSNARSNAQGVVTVSNHISTLDDPLTWGVLPARYYLHSRLTRWSLGASDIMFTNPIFSAFFRYGQVLETIRGKGTYQAAVDTAIEKLNRGDWIHLYGEGKVNQPDTYMKGPDGAAILPRFKWGVGKILSSPSITPVVIPMWITGFDSLMPEGRPFPYKFLPRLGARLSVTFGSPLPADMITSTIGRIKSARQPAEKDMDLERRMITEVTAVVHRAVQDLGRTVSGSSLGAPVK